MYLYHIHRQQILLCAYTIHVYVGKPLAYYAKKYFIHSFSAPGYCKLHNKTSGCSGVQLTYPVNYNLLVFILKLTNNKQKPTNTTYLSNQEGHQCLGKIPFLG